MLALLFRSLEFAFYALLLRGVDWMSQLPRETQPDAMRLYRENLALKAQLHALQMHLATVNGSRKPRIPLYVRAAQVFAYLLTRGSDQFHRYQLSDSAQTIRRWASVFRGFHAGRRGGGRPPTDPAVVDLIVTLKRENPLWGARRICDELRRMGVKVSQPTISRILSDNGFPPTPKRAQKFEILKTSVKDALWAIDFFAVRTVKGKYVQVLLIIDVATRELMDLRVHDGWDVDAAWTVRALNRVVTLEGRKPSGRIHDHGLTFAGQFERQMRVLDVEQHVTPAHLPWCNCFAERAIYSIRRELLSHVTVKDAHELQWYLDEYRRYANLHRAHQGLDGQAPIDLARPEAKVLELDLVRRKRIERKTFAHGLLSAYELVDGPRKAA